MGEKRRQLLQNPERPIQDTSFPNIGFLPIAQHKATSLPPTYHQASPSFLTSPFSAGSGSTNPSVISTNPIIHPISGSFGSSFPPQTTPSSLLGPGPTAPVIHSRPELMSASTVTIPSQILPSSQPGLASKPNFSEEEIRAFQSSQFVFKYIPEHAPPPEWCT
jgi:hypothetical protein